MRALFVIIVKFSLNSQASGNGDAFRDGTGNGTVRNDGANFRFAEVFARKKSENRPPRSKRRP